VYQHAQEIAEEKDMTLKAAIGYMCRQGGFDA